MNRRPYDGVRRVLWATLYGLVAGIATRVVATLMTASLIDERVAVLVMVTFVAPVLAGEERKQAANIAVSGDNPRAAVLRLTAVWLRPHLPLVSICGCVLFATLPSITFAALSFAYSLTVVALAALIRRHAAVIGTIASGLCFAWLTWPLWLADHLTTVPAWLTKLHPIFAADAITGGVAWAEQAEVYARTPLGSDLAYALPDSAWPATAAHVIVATLLFAIVTWRRRPRQR